jgi:Holliday junction resolvase RusA-like endonuclease
LTAGHIPGDNFGNVESAPTGGTGHLFLRLSPPPSVNHIWNRGRGGKVYRSRSYQTWITRNLFHTGRQVRQVDGPVHVSVTINGGKGWRKGRDIDNVLKPLMDFLQHIGAITDDCAEVVNSIYIRFTPPGKPADKSYVDVVVQPA